MDMWWPLTACMPTPVESSAMLHMLCSCTTKEQNEELPRIGLASDLNMEAPEHTLLEVVAFSIALSSCPY